MLTRPQQTTLLSIARDSIARQLDGVTLAVEPGDYDEVLRKPAGAFVTLKRGGELRGCIGSVLPVDPVCRAVARSAVHAAFHDPRFHPLQREELPAVRLEISVMGPIVPVREIEEIVPGRDGLIIRQRDRAGLLLPQVATEHGWDRETFLAHTCFKAGLGSEAWHDPATRIERFSAEVFGE